MKAIKKISVYFLIFLMILTLLPVNALAYDHGGATYDDNDYAKIRDFLNSPSDTSGMTNGQILNANYESNDPATWSGVTWQNGRVTSIDWSDKAYLNGALDVSGLTELTALYCGGNKINSLTFANNTSLTNISCAGNELTSLNLSAAPSLEQLYCEDNNLLSINLNQNSNLVYLNCSSNNLSSLDLSNNSELNTLYCQNNEIKNLKIILFDTYSEIIARNNGYVYIQDSDISDAARIYGQPAVNSSLTNWMINDSIVSTGSSYTAASALDSPLYANFSSFVTFDSQEGSSVAKKSVPHQSLCAEPEPPAKQNSVFWDGIKSNPA